ncbi:MAG: hypothetical protein AAGF49_17200, partial [Pseudomonadota bacterium]
MKSRLLITGFGPFPGVPDNPAAALVSHIAQSGLPVSTEILPTEWAICQRMPGLARSVTRLLMFGVASEARRIRYERVAHPVADALPDAVGALPDGAPIMSRRSAMPIAVLRAAARREGFPVSVSHSPGRYICNASYAAALSGNPHTLFVHIPEPSGRGSQSFEVLKDHALWLAAVLASDRV